MAAMSDTLTRDSVHSSSGRWFRSLALGALALLGIIWGNPAAAQVCEIAYNPFTFTEGPPGAVRQVGFAIGGTCGPTVSGTVTVGSSLTPLNPAQLNWSGTSGDTFVVDFQLGTNNGVYDSLLVSCTSGCDTGGTTALSFDAITDTVYDLQPVGPTTLSMPPGQSLTLSVRQLRDGDPASGEIGGEFTFWFVSSGGSIGSSSVQNDPDTGIASNTFTANAPGTYTVTVKGRCFIGEEFRPSASTPISPGIQATICPADVVFTINVVTRTMAITGGNNQTGPTGVPYTDPLTVQVLANGIAQAGVDIDWDVTEGNALLSTDTTTTVASGQASVNVTPTSPEGTIKITASLADDPAIKQVFTLRSTTDRTLSVVSGDDQTGLTNTPAAMPLVVLAQDNGVNIPGAAIQWEVQNGDASISSSATTTDNAGESSIIVTFGADPGPVVVIARRAEDRTAFAAFTLVSRANQTLVIAGGDGQTGPTGTVLATPLSVLAQNDGANAANANITWAVQSGSASLGSNSNRTDASGIASNTITLGAVNGPIVITATRQGPSPVTVSFNLSSTTVRTLDIVSGNNQTGATGQSPANPLVVIARDNGLAASGKTITWSATNGASVPASSVTDGSGNASITVTFGATPGPVTVTGTRADDTSATVSFTLTSTLTRTLAIVSGNNQSAPTGQSPANPLVVIARDNGLAASGKTITWSATNGASVPASSVTDGSGNASITVTFGATPGPVTVTGTRADDTSATVSFTLTSTAALPPTLSLVSGNGQGGLVETSADAPLVVRLLDGNGAAMSGESISWQVVSGAASLTGSSSITDGSGAASIGFSFAAPAGNILIRASALAGSLSVDVSASSQFGSLAAASGDGQSGPASQALPLPLEVAIALPLPRSAMGASSPQSLAGATVQWQVLSGGGTVSSTTSTTNASGRASTILTLGPTAGANTVKATVLGGGSVTFSATGTVATVLRTLEILDGNNQSGIVGSTLPLPLDVMARNDGNGQSGVGITWAVVSGSATLSTTSTTTDSDGESEVTVDLGATPGPITISATRNDEAGATVTFTLTADPEPGVATLAVVSGNNQRGLYQTEADAPLVVRLLDGNGQAIVGESINWSVRFGPVQLDLENTSSDSNGLASVGFSFGAFAGTSEIVATFVDEDESIVEVEFYAYTDNPDLLIVSGNNQSGPAGSTLPIDFVVQVAEPDERGGSSAQSLSGITVTWSVEEGDGSLGSYTSTTDAQGRASTRLQLGSEPGNNLVRASVGSQTCDYPLAAGKSSPQVACYSASVTFQAQGLAPDNELVIVSGNNQTANSGTALASDFVVEVRPVGLSTRGAAGATPLAAGVEVRWDVVQGDGSLSSSSTFTDANGRAAVRYTLAANASGSQRVQASIGEDGSCEGRGPLDFCNNTSTVEFNAYAEEVRTLSAITPTTVTVAVGETANLGVRYLVNGQDADEDTLWSVSPSGPSLGASRVSTNSSGEARNTFVSNAAGSFVVSVGADCDFDKDRTSTKEYSYDCPEEVEFTISVENRDLTALPGLTPQQQAVAGAINEFCPRLAGIASNDANLVDLRTRCNELFQGMGSDPDGVIEALDQLYSDVAVVQSLSSLLAAQTQFDNIKARIAALRSGTQGSDFGGLAFSNGSGGLVPVGAMFQNLADGGESKQEVGSDFSRWGFFASGIIGQGESDASLLNPGYDYDIRGLTMGVDYRKSDKLIFGATVGYNRQDNQLTGGEGDLQTSGWSLSAFTTYYLNNSWYADAVLSWGSNQYDMLRKLSYTISYPNGTSTTVNQFGRSNSDGSSLSFASSVGRDFNRGAWGFGPYARLQYSKLSFDTITETMQAGQLGSGLALVIDTDDVTSLSTILGGKLTYTHSTSWGVVIPHFQFEWQREHQDDPSKVEAYFLHDPTKTPFVISGDPIDSDFYRLGAGLSMLFTKGRSGFFYWERMIGREGTQQDNFAAGIRLEF